MDIIWKDVVGFEDYFKVSSDGQIWSKRTQKILKQETTKSGYKVFSTKLGGRNGQAKLFRVHRLVAEAFLDNPNPLEKTQVNHIDANKANNHVSNLEWVTFWENIEHAKALGLYQKPPHKTGFNNPKSKLTLEQALYIRENPANLTIRELGKKFGVHHRTILRYKNKQITHN